MCSQPSMHCDPSGFVQPLERLLHGESQRLGNSPGINPPIGGFLQHRPGIHQSREAEDIELIPKLQCKGLPALDVHASTAVRNVNALAGNSSGHYAFNPYSAI